MENEKIIGVYQLELGALALPLQKLFDAYFTNQRLVGSYIEGRAFTAKFRGLPTRGCSGCLFGWALWPLHLADYLIIIPFTKRKGERLSTDPEQILKADKRNFAWNYKDIKAIEFTKKNIVWGQYYIKIELLNGKPQIFGYDRKHGKELSKLMGEVMPGKVTIKAI